MVRFLRLGNKPKITNRTAVGLTDTGKREAERFASKGVTFAILSALNEQSPQTIKNLSEETQVPISEIMARVKMLASQGYVRLTGVEV